MTNPCNCKAEHWQPHADSCPQAKQNKGAAMTSDVLKILRGQRVDGRTVDEVMALAADEIEGAHRDITRLMDSLNGEVNESQRLRQERHQLQNDLTAAGLENEHLRAIIRRAAKAELTDVARVALGIERPSHEPNAARLLVAKQAEDEGLWIEAQTVTEAYLQQELRKLHAAVEGTEKKSNVGTTYRGFPDGSCQECGEELGMHICPAGAEEKAGNVR